MTPQTHMYHKKKRYHAHLQVTRKKQAVSKISFPDKLCNYLTEIEFHHNGCQ